VIAVADGFQTHISSNHSDWRNKTRVIAIWFPKNRYHKVTFLSRTAHFVIASCRLKSC